MGQPRWAQLRVSPAHCWARRTHLEFRHLNHVGEHPGVALVLESPFVGLATVGVRQRTRYSVAPLEFWYWLPPLGYPFYPCPVSLVMASLSDLILSRFTPRSLDGFGLDALRKAKESPVLHVEPASGRQEWRESAGPTARFPPGEVVNVDSPLSGLNVA